MYKSGAENSTSVFGGTIHFELQIQIQNLNSDKTKQNTTIIVSLTEMDQICAPLLFISLQL